MPDRLPAGALYAGDLKREIHLGRTVTVDGVTGVLRDVHHIDDQFSELIVGAVVVSVGAGRPVHFVPA